ncbi:MAG TPA: RHS repeat-associated core domain-containing protein [Anaerolineales bacterium]|nr:RHS repeat-associated core domain-containing protein [Anaerolineales bacterium]
MSELRYRAFGETRFAWGTTPTDYRFTGQREESLSGLYDYGARWYDPAVGRFIQADTLVPEVVSSQAWDRYAYALNSPLRYADPTGHRVTECGWQGEECGRGSKLETVEEYPPPPPEPEPEPREKETLTDRALKGDVLAMLQLFLPTHFGGRLQGELAYYIFSVSVGGNIVLNRVDGRLAANLGWSAEGGPGILGGGALTLGPLFGFDSSSVEDVVSGYSASISASAAARFAGTVSLSVPFEREAISEFPFHVDPEYGQVPSTVYVGGGAGGVYAGAGVGGGGSFKNGSGWFQVELTPLRPWNWSMWQ